MYWHVTVRYLWCRVD